MRVIGFSIALLLIGSDPGAARAHGRFPETHGVTIHPSDPSSLVAGSTFGPIQSTDGGVTWRWACEAALLLNALEDPHYVLMDDGSLIASGFGGLQRSEGSLCAFAEPDDDVGFAITDAVRDPGDGSAAFAVTSSGGGATNGLFRSTDDGRTWEPTGDPIEPILFESLLVASGGRIYLSGVYPRTSERPQPEAFIHRSSDGGVTWERFAFDALWSAADRTLLLQVVDPADPDHLFATVLPDFDVDRGALLVQSRDGGETWEAVAEHRELGGMVYADDGTLFLGLEWVAMPNDPTMPVVPYPHGLLRSDDGGATFTVVRNDLDVGCLGWRDGSLWACADEYRDGFMLGESTDGGATFEARLRLTEMAGPVLCDDGDPTAMRCATRDQDVACDFSVETDAEVLMCDGGPGPADAGPETGDGGGCGCRTTGTGDGLPFLFLFVALTMRRRTL